MISCDTLLNYIMWFGYRVCGCQRSLWWYVFFFFQAEDGIRDRVRSRGLGDVYKRQVLRTPLYHVRYVFTYAPPFALLLALGVINLWRWRASGGRTLAILASAALIVLSALSMQRAWNEPALAADDHRAAVRFLSSHWRPGDVILVNAGYAYTALLAYWDQPIAWRGRLADFSPATATNLAGTAGAITAETGGAGQHVSLGGAGTPRAHRAAAPAARS